MTQPSVQPKLTPQFCFNTTALRDFLRLSRSSIDDSITQNLNALPSASSAPFDPNSVHIRTPRPRSQVDPAACETFKSQVLFPSWQARTDILTYCAGVAASPDPDDPDAVVREAEKMKRREMVVDERLDPYSGRFFPREGRTERLAGVVRLEMGVEEVVRRRTWEVVRERCGGDGEEEWLGAVGAWRSAGQGKGEGR